MKKIFVLVLIVMMAMMAMAETKYESHVTVYSGEEESKGEESIIGYCRLIRCEYYCDKCNTWFDAMVEDQYEHIQSHKKWYNHVADWIDDNIIFWND